MSDSDRFELTALALYAEQRVCIPAYDQWCQHELSQRGSDAQVRKWHEIPALPIEAFKSLDVFDPTAPVAAEWHSSGTTAQGQRRSTHRLADLTFYDSAIDEGVNAMLIPDIAAGKHKPIVCVQLQPSLSSAPHSSLSYMFDRIRLGRNCIDGGCFVSPSFKVDVKGGWSVLHDLADSGTPVLLLSTSFSLMIFLDGMIDHQLPSLKLAFGSRVVDTGGFKGRTREIGPRDLAARVTQMLGVPAEWQENEYGMSELSSQAWLGTIARTLHSQIHVSEGRWLPSTLRCRVVDPSSLKQVPDGEEGLLVFYDIANVHSCVAIRTEDVAIRRGDSFELAGRAPSALLKGCSLRLEEAL